MELDDAVRAITVFRNGPLKERLRSLEIQYRGVRKQGARGKNQKSGVDKDLLVAAAKVKAMAGQINVVIHAAGILAALPHILQENEVVEQLSLGAGNTGKSFDLETNRQIAEFKFITWRGGSESIRQNSVFKDFFGLAEAETDKRRVLYLYGCQQATRFLTGSRNLGSVMSRNSSLAKKFRKQYGKRLSTVRDYYGLKRTLVEIVDLQPILRELEPPAMTT